MNKDLLMKAIANVTIANVMFDPNELDSLRATMKTSGWAPTAEERQVSGVAALHEALNALLELAAAEGYTP